MTRPQRCSTPRIEVCHALCEYNARRSKGRSAVAFDGTAELWFDTVEDKDRFYSDPDYLALFRPDESGFADMAGTVFFVTAEETVL